MIKKSRHLIDEFLYVIPESQIERILGKREFKRFCKFMYGQTATKLPENDSGIYRGDLERFLKGDWTLYD